MPTLLAAYSFDGQDGTDASGNGNAGTANANGNGSAFIAGHGGGYALGNSSGANVPYVTVPASSAVNPTGAWTAMAWVAPFSNVTPALTIMQSVGGTGYIELLANASNGTVGIITNTATDSFGAWVGPGTLNGAVWNHIAATYDGSSTVTVYLNGTAGGTHALTGTYSYGGSARGVYLNYGDYTGLGPSAVDDVRLYSGALTGAQITTCMNTAVGTTADPIGGSPSKHGAASGGFGFAGSASGHASRHGSAAGSTAWHGAASGHTSRHGAASGTFRLAGSASGHVARHGAASGTFTWHGVAAGHSTRHGSASGTFTWSGVTAGRAPSVGGKHGAASGGYNFTGAAVGHVARRGVAAGSFVWHGAASGRTSRNGSAGGTFTFAGVAAGHAPTVGAKHGAASGGYSFTGHAAGHTARHSAASGVYSFTGHAAGHHPLVGGDRTINVTVTLAAQTPRIVATLAAQTPRLTAALAAQPTEGGP